MIINNINGSDNGNGGPMTYTQTGQNTPQKITGSLKSGHYTAPFKPIGDPPFTVVLEASNGFTVNGIQSPDEMITFYNVGSGTKPLDTKEQA
jgi:hypothetical protein